MKFFIIALALFPERLLENMNNEKVLGLILFDLIYLSTSTDQLNVQKFV